MVGHNKQKKKKKKKTKKKKRKKEIKEIKKKKKLIVRESREIEKGCKFKNLGVKE
jgi:hypothetical protein